MFRIILDESGATTNMTRLYGRAPSAALTAIHCDR